MHHFKKYGGTFKGLAGECMFKLTRKHTYLTRFHPLDFILRKYKEKLTEKQINFIKDNWLTFDAIDFENKITLFEIKTRNIERHHKRYKIILTRNCYDSYMKAEKLGFQVYVAIVLLYDDWNYSVELKPFQKIVRTMWIENNGKYDKRKYRNNQI